MGTIGKLTKLNKYFFKGWYDNYLLESAANISAHMNAALLFSNQEDLEKAVIPNKIVDTQCGRLYVNSNNKTFLVYEGVDYTQNILSLLEQEIVYPDDIFNAFNKGIFPQELQEICVVPKLRIMPFSYLTKVEFIDRTTVDESRIYTMESNVGNAVFGAMVGSMFDRTVFDNNAITGAIIGSSGARRITEKVDRTVNTAFDVILYFNDINNLSQTIRFYNEAELREFIAALEFIMNNKEGSNEDVKEIELKKNELKVGLLSACNNGVNKCIYVLLAVFFGYLGVHHFYAKNMKKGVMYLLFCWTLIPCLFALFDIINALVMPANEVGEIQVD